MGYLHDHISRFRTLTPTISIPHPDSATGVVPFPPTMLIYFDRQPTWTYGTMWWSVVVGNFQSSAHGQPPQNDSRRAGMSFLSLPGAQDTRLMCLRILPQASITLAPDLQEQAILG